MTRNAMTASSAMVRRPVILLPARVRQEHLSSVMTALTVPTTPVMKKVTCVFTHQMTPIVLMTDCSVPALSSAI